MLTCLIIELVHPVETPTSLRSIFKDLYDRTHFLRQKEIIGIQKTDDVTPTSREPSIESGRLASVLLYDRNYAVAVSGHHFSGTIR
jgi:hypothetical protein